MGLVEDIGSYLLGQHLADYLLGTQPTTVAVDPTQWALGYRTMPELPDQVVLLTEYAGNVPAFKVGADYPGLQVRVRGQRKAGAVVNAKIRSIYLALMGVALPLRINGSQYNAIQPQQSGPLQLPYDQQNERAECSWNFIVWRSL